MLHFFRHTCELTVPRLIPFPPFRFSLCIVLLYCTYAVVCKIAANFTKFTQDTIAHLLGVKCAHFINISSLYAAAGTFVHKHHLL